MSKELYSEYLGEGYHDKVRKLLTADDKICTDTMIDSDVVIGAMQSIVTSYLEGAKFTVADEGEMFGRKAEVHTEEQFAVLQQAALFILAGILCSPIISRTKMPPFVGQKYKKNWKKKQEKMMKNGHLYLQSLTGRMDT